MRSQISIPYGTSGGMASHFMLMYLADSGEELFTLHAVAIR